MPRINNRGTCAQREADRREAHAAAQRRYRARVKAAEGKRVRLQAEAKYPVARRAAAPQGRNEKAAAMVERMVKRYSKAGVRGRDLMMVVRADKTLANNPDKAFIANQVMARLG